MADSITDRPDHPWVGDADGHNCEGCPDGNIWRCDRAAHSAVTVDDRPWVRLRNEAEFCQPADRNELLAEADRLEAVEGRRIISQAVRNAVAGPIADVVQKHRKDPMVHSETIADFIINRLLESDGLLADLLGRNE